jgi:Protein of unknown function DUF262/Protein of unknown function (DUF1524)
MKADTHNLTEIFFAPTQYLIPIFQRPYVWGLDPNWISLWEDLRILVETRIVANEAGTGPPGPPLQHFLGVAVLELDTERSRAARVQCRRLIDGQQRFTTLQILVRAVQHLMLSRGMHAEAQLLANLTENPAVMVQRPSDSLKVLPGAADRSAFADLMRADDVTKCPPSVFTAAYAFFYKAIAEWADVSVGGDVYEARLIELSNTLTTAVRVVTLDLDQGDNPQVIFETLNSRGTALNAADLVKNFVFQQIPEQEAERLYAEYWAVFEGADWRREQRQGRLYRPRVDLFLFHWLTMKGKAEISATQIFPAFVSQVRSSAQPISLVLQGIRRNADLYDRFDRYPFHTLEGQFFYRLRLMDTSTMMPVLLHLLGILDREDSSARRQRALRALESWLVRRMLCRLQVRNYNHSAIEILKTLDGRDEDPDQALIDFLKASDTDVERWPRDSEVELGLLTLPAYTSLTRARVRFVLEAIEWRLRTNQVENLAALDGRQLTIEHILPQDWSRWDAETPDAVTLSRRQALVHTLGNLTLLTAYLNPSVSNDPWIEKQAGIEKKSLLMLSKDVVSKAVWDEDAIVARTRVLVDLILKIWPGPDTF